MLFTETTECIDTLHPSLLNPASLNSGTGDGQNWEQRKYGCLIPPAWCGGGAVHGAAVVRNVVTASCRCREAHSIFHVLDFGRHRGHCRTATARTLWNRTFRLRWPAAAPPKGGRGCLMSPPCLESQGCHLIPLCYLLSCSSA